jgi:hypothetical protein
MIGKPEWFRRRKYGGWGLFPATWQGWTYLAVFMFIAFGVQFVPTISEAARMIILAILVIVLFADTIDIMIKMKKDERETLHEALAERNALWAILLILTVGVAYEAAQSMVISNKVEIDPVIIIAIFGGLIAKAATNYYLDKRN